LPDPQEHADKLEHIQREKFAEMIAKITEFRMSIDSKMVSLRKEFDINFLKKSIEKKINTKEVHETMQQSEGKIKMLDSNIMLIAQDFERFQKIISKMHSNINELQEINKDVLLGKKNTNCLSCNKGKDGFGNTVNVKGKDGKLYFGSQDNTKSQSWYRNNRQEDNNSETTRVVVDFNLNSGTDINSPNH